MKSPIILQGEAFDWNKGKKCMDAAVGITGEVNWYAAFGADPGCIKCPGCQTFLWKEGKRVECPDCHTVFDVL